MVDSNSSMDDGECRQSSARNPADAEQGERKPTSRDLQMTVLHLAALKRQEFSSLARKALLLVELLRIESGAAAFPATIGAELEQSHPLSVGLFFQKCSFDSKLASGASNSSRIFSFVTTCDRASSRAGRQAGRQLTDPPGGPLRQSSLRLKVPLYRRPKKIVYPVRRIRACPLELISIFRAISPSSARVALLL